MSIESKSPSELMYFYRKFRRKLAGDLSFRMPKKLLDVINGDLLVVEKNCYENSLNIYEKAIFSKKEEFMTRSLDLFAEKDYEVFTAFHRNFIHIRLIRNRIKLPPDYCQYIGIRGSEKLVILGNGNIIKVCSEKEYLKNDVPNLKDLLRRANKPTGSV